MDVTATRLVVFTTGGILGSDGLSIAINGGRCTGVSSIANEGGVRVGHRLFGGHLVSVSLILSHAFWFGAEGGEAREFTEVLL